MNKIIITIVGIIFLIGIITAGAISLTNTSYDIPTKTATPRVEGYITFTIDGKTNGSCYLNEPNMDIEDDLEDCLNQNYQNKVITDIQDWNGRTLVEKNINGYVYKSFNQTKLDEIESLGI